MADQPNITELTTDIVSAFVSANKIGVGELPALIQSVSKTLGALSEPEIAAEPELAKATPAQVRKSIKPHALVSFEDGKEYKTLKRHLSKLGLSVEEYKAKHGLPKDYPTTSPDYSAKRSEMARALGLGRKAGEAPAKAAVSALATPTAAKLTPGTANPKKSNKRAAAEAAAAE